MADEKTGFGRRITIQTTSPAVTASFLETETTDPGYIGDDKIDQTSNANTRFNSFCEGDLVTKSPGSATVYYLRSKRDELKSIVNVPGVVTITDKLGNTTVDNGWLKDFDPQPATKGARPTANITWEYEGENDAGVDSEVNTIV